MVCDVVCTLVGRREELVLGNAVSACVFISGCPRPSSDAGLALGLSRKRRRVCHEASRWAFDLYGDKSFSSPGFGGRFADSIACWIINLKLFFIILI